jgi:hypothetical protein
MTLKTPVIVLASIVALATGCAFRDESGTLPASSQPTTQAPEQKAATPANPTGSGEKVSQKIDNKTGGSVELKDGTKIEVPPDALPPGVEEITVTSAPEPAPAEYKSVSPKFVFEPEGTVFLKPLKVSFPVTIPEGTSTDKLTVLWSRHNAEGFDMVPTQFVAGADAKSFTAIAEVTHFSFGFCGEKYEPTADPHPVADPYK